MIWLKQSEWPDDTEELIFLPRAITALGRAKFADQWNGTEPFAVALPPEVSWETQAFKGFGKGWSRQIALDLIARHEPGRVLGAVERDPAASSRMNASHSGTMTLAQWSGIPLPSALSKDDWRLAGELAVVEVAAALRWAETVQALKQALASGQLASFGRRVSGAVAAVPMSRVIWNVEGETLASRFREACIDWDRPDLPVTHDGGPPVHRRFYVFVERVGFERFVMIPKSDPIAAATNNRITAFADALTARIVARPEAQELTRDQARDWSLKEFGLHGRGFERGWDEAKRRGPSGHVWGKGGRPKKSQK